MRPSKHATHAQIGAQEIFDISIARLATTKSTIPVVATSESEKITLFTWNESEGRWRSTDINHVPIEAPRGVPSITNTWNWSRRVGLTTFDKIIAVVYKRAERVEETESPKPPLLMLDTYHLDNGIPRRDLRIQVPMPTFTQTVPGIPPRIRTVAELPGFELWAGVDLERRKLLIVTQTLGEDATADGDNAELKLLIGELDRLDVEDAWTSLRIDRGGYGLDVRNDGAKLFLAYRTTPQVLKIPLPFGMFDPFFGGAPQIELDAQAASDQFYSPLRVTTLDLATFSTRTLDLPGGEHPRIQNVNPLFVVVDRPRLRVRFRVVRVGQRSEPRLDWALRGIEKQAFFIDDSERVARGVLTSLREDDRPTFPRTGAPWIDSQDLFTSIDLSGVGWASTRARFPLEPLRFDQDDKGLFFDFLQKAPRFALLESRARVLIDLLQGVLTVTNLQSVVYDINHGQFGPPESLRPDTTGEIAQFAPFERLTQPAGNILVLPAYVPDNTIGGSLLTDRDGVPYQFFSYVDLGDGGLRVIFDLDLGPPDEPPPNEKPKTLEPDRVPGPGSADERWIELTTSDWQDAEVPTIRMETVGVRLPTITSSVHQQIESLLEGAFTFTQLPPIEDGGWSEDQVNSIQTALHDFMIESGAQPEVVFSGDDETPRAFISMLPETVVADADTIWEAGFEDEEDTVASVEWLFTSPIVGPSIGAQPLVFVQTGNRIPVVIPFAGDWIVGVTITRNDGTIRTFETVVTVEESLFRKTSSVHRQIANRDLDPPLNSLGTVRIGSATFKLLQYELQFTVGPDELVTHHVLIKTLDQTDAQWRFREDGTRQGLIDYRLRIKFETTDVRLGGLLGLLLKVESINGSFFYGRSFTPGLLMNDTRSVDPLTGDESASDGLRRGNSPRLAAALTARPYGNDSTTKDSVDVKVNMFPQAAAASVIVLLLGIGATAAATALTVLVAALGAAVAAAAVPVVGLVGTAAVIAATLAIFIFINFVVPPLVEKSLEDGIEAGFVSADTRESLAEANLLQFAGEGAAEALARKVIGEVDDAELEELLAGDARYRQDLFQMVHVSEGRARVLIRG